MIDDFVVSDERHLTSVEAVVSMFNSFGESTLHSVLGWRVEIYSSPVAARTNLDGDVASYFVAPPSAQIDTNWFPQNVGAGKVTLPVAIGLAASGTFWIGVIPVLSYSTSGQIGIRDSEFQGSPGNGNNIQVNPGGGFALPGNWMSRNGNSAYRITAVPEPATACASALGLVALLFRSRRHS